MLRINNRGFKRSYVYGGSGIFDSIASAASRLLGKETVKRAATQAVQRVAAEAGKKLGEKAVQKITSKSKNIFNKGLTPKSRDILNKYTAPRKDINLNSLIDGSAIKIQDYVKTF